MTNTPRKCTDELELLNGDVLDCTRTDDGSLPGWLPGIHRSSNGHTWIAIHFPIIGVRGYWWPRRQMTPPDD